MTMNFICHISRHPERSWSVILQQVWSMKHRDRIYWNDGMPSNSSYNNNSPARSGSAVSQAGFSSGGNTPKGKGGEPCRRFNREKCKFGATCRYDHRCSYCHKFGHAVINCRKLLADMDKGGKRTSSKEGTGDGANA